MRLTVVGLGYLGLTHAVCMAELGHEVIGLDTDAEKVARASRGEVPFFEPGLEPLLRKNLEAGRLRFTTSYAEEAGCGDVHFICVGTPQTADGSADLRQVHAAVDALSAHLCEPCLVVGKSTVPVGTARALMARITNVAPAGHHVELAWNPEFLREGFAVQDSLSPDRFVFGVASQRSSDLLHQVYAVPLASGVPALVMDLETAELVKVSANAFLATKISFINAMAEVCERVGADVVRLADALGHDERIGKRFLAPGLGFGGGCLPKDIRAFRVTAEELGAGSIATILAEVESINLNRRSRVVQLTRDVAGGTVSGSRIAVLGLAFKPGSDDLRDSPSLHVCDLLRGEGAVVTAHDPVAMPNAARILPDIRYAASVSATVADADVVLHLTEWADYRVIDPVLLGSIVARRNIIDARCSLDAELWRSAGWSFRALGRPEGPSRDLRATFGELRKGVGGSMKSPRKELGLTEDPQPSGQRPSRSRRRSLLIVTTALLAITSGVVAYLLTGGQSHAGVPAGAVSSAGSPGASANPSGHSGRGVAIPPGGEKGSTALTALGSDALPLPAYLQHKVKAWNVGRGGAALNAVSGDLGIVTQNGGMRQYVTMKAACGTLATAVRAAQSGRPIPYAAMQKLYSAALTKLAAGARECFVAISVTPDGDEYDETTVNQSNMHQAQSDFKAGANDLYRATAEIEALGR